MQDDLVDLGIAHVSPGDSVVTAVVEAIMAATGATRPPEDPVYDAVNPDVLDWIVSGDEDTSVRVGFEYAGCDVTVRGDGTVTALASSTEHWEADAPCGLGARQYWDETTEE